VPTTSSSETRAIIGLMYDTGLRVGELVAVDVDMLRG